MKSQIEDRRVFERFSARYPAKFKYARADFGANLLLRDVSAGGARIVSKEKISMNDKIDLEVELPDGRSPLNLSGKVTWTKPGAPGEWDAGIQFDKMRLMQLQRIYKFSF